MVHTSPRPCKGRLVLTAMLVVICCNFCGFHIGFSTGWRARRSARKSGEPPTAGDCLRRLTEAARRGDVQSAKQSFEEFRQANGEIKTDTYGQLMLAAVRGSNYSQAVEFFEEMKQKGLTPSLKAYTTLIDGFAKDANLPEAERWFHELQKQPGLKADVGAYSSVINAASQSSNLSAAEDWFTRLVEDDLKPNVVVFNALIATAARSKNASAAEKWYHRMTVAGVRPNMFIYGSLMSLASKIRDPAKAEYWWEEMARQDVAPDVVAYTTMMDVYAKTEQLEKAEVLFHQMEECIENVDMLAFQPILEGYARLGNLAKFEEWTNRLLKSGVPLNTLVCTLSLECYQHLDHNEKDKKVVDLLDIMWHFQINPDIPFMTTFRAVMGDDRFGELCATYNHDPKMGRGRSKPIYGRFRSAARKEEKYSNMKRMRR